MLLSLSPTWGCRPPGDHTSTSKCPCLRLVPSIRAPPTLAPFQLTAWGLHSYFLLPPHSPAVYSGPHPLRGQLSILGMPWAHHTGLSGALDAVLTPSLPLSFPFGSGMSSPLFFLLSALCSVQPPLLLPCLLNARVPRGSAFSPSLLLPHSGVAMVAMVVMVAMMVMVMTVVTVVVMMAMVVVMMAMVGLLLQISPHRKRVRSGYAEASDFLGLYAHHAFACPSLLSVAFPFLLTLVHTGCPRLPGLP